MILLSCVFRHIIWGKQPYIYLFKLTEALFVRTMFHKKNVYSVKKCIVIIKPLFLFALIFSSLPLNCYNVSMLTCSCNCSI